MMNDHVCDFFGAAAATTATNTNKKSLQTSVWTVNDIPLGEAIVQHYQCCTIPKLESGIDASNRHAMKQVCFSDNSSNDTDNNEKDNLKSSGSIPPLIHFIWLGNKRMPLRNDDESNDDENECIRSWRYFHPQWTIRVWREDDVLQAHSMGQWFNANAIQFAIDHENYGMASDIVRLELLYTHGGLYVDIDYLCLDSVSDLHNHPHVDFYCGASNTGAIELNNGLMASVPNHGLVQYMRERIQTDWNSRNHVFRFIQPKITTTTTTTLQLQDTLTALLHRYMDHETRMSWDHANIGARLILTPEQVIRHTGPGLLTTSIGHILLNQEQEEQPMTATRPRLTSSDVSRLVIVPFHVFHPLPNKHRKVSLAMMRDEDMIKSHIVGGETKAIHLWQCSWQD